MPNNTNEPDALSVAEANMEKVEQPDITTRILTFTVNVKVTSKRLAELDIGVLGDNIANYLGAVDIDDLEIDEDEIEEGSFWAPNGEDITDFEITVDSASFNESGDV